MFRDEVMCSRIEWLRISLFSDLVLCGCAVSCRVVSGEVLIYVMRVDQIHRLILVNLVYNHCGVRKYHKLAVILFEICT